MNTKINKINIILRKYYLKKNAKPKTNIYNLSLDLKDDGHITPTTKLKVAGCYFLIGNKLVEK